MRLNFKHCSWTLCFLTAPYTRNPKVIWEESHRHPSWQRITMPQSPTGDNRMPHIYPQNCHFPLMISTPSNTSIPRLTPLTTPSGIQIQSVVFPQFTHRIVRQTDKWTKQQLCSNTRLCSVVLIESNVAKMVMIMTTKKV